jgi:cell division protein FtsL
VNEWSQVFLGVIAVATAIMAGVQIFAIVVLSRVSGQVQSIVATIQSDIRPLISRANAIAEEASKTAILATAQAQKIDRMVTDLTRRVDETSAVIQHAILTPAREGMAIFAAFKAGFNVLKGLGMRDMRGRHGGVDDEDALFIG